jgi:hypothetical protein
MEVTQRNQPSQIKVEAIEYEGKPRIDVRLWVFAKQLDKMIPTRRGLSIRLDQLEAVRSQLVAAERALKDAA